MCNLVWNQKLNYSCTLNYATHFKHNCTSSRLYVQYNCTMTFFVNPSANTTHCMAFWKAKTHSLLNNVGSRQHQVNHARLRLGCSSLNYDLHRRNIIPPTPYVLVVPLKPYRTISPSVQYMYINYSQHKCEKCFDSSYRNITLDLIILIFLIILYTCSTDLLVT